MTVKELHEKFDRCCKEGIPFEYECLWDGYEAVRHTDLGYCMLISEEDAAMKETLYGDDLFYELELLAVLPAVHAQGDALNGGELPVHFLADGEAVLAVLTHLCFLLNFDV